MSDIRKKTVQGLKQGDTFTVTRTFAAHEVTRFAEMSRDYNPIHFDPRFISSKGFSGPICHGLLVASMLTEIGGQIGWLATGMELRFKHPVYFGDTITCRFTLDEVDEHRRARATFMFTNADNVMVLEASLTGFLPGLDERKIMAEMISEGDPTNPLHLAGVKPTGGRG